MQHWNIDYLKQLKEQYEALIELTEDPMQSLQYQNTLNSILCVIERYYEMVHKPRFTTFNCDILSFNDMMLSDLHIIDKYGYSCPYIRALNDYNQKLIINPYELGKVDTTIGKVLKVSNDFYSQFSGIFKENYANLSKNFRNTLHFKKIGNNAKEFGQTYSIYKTDITFFEIGYCYTAQDYISAIHEFSHGISCSLNPEAMWDIEKYCLIEVDSLFFELLGIDYIGDNLDLQRDSFNISIECLYDYLLSAELICTKLDMFNTLTYKDLKSKRIVKKYLTGVVGNDKQEINDILTSYIRDIMHYIISYLTAIELYLVYQDSHDKALDLLLQIIKKEERSNKEYLEFIKSLELEPGSHFDNYIEILMNKAKELKDEKSLRYKN